MCVNQWLMNTQFLGGKLSFFLNILQSPAVSGIGKFLTLQVIDFLPAFKGLHLGQESVELGMKVFKHSRWVFIFYGTCVQFKTLATGISVGFLRNVLPVPLCYLNRSSIDH